MKSDISKYMATIGAKGGSVKSAAKTASAKAAVNARWAKYRAAKKKAPDAG